MTPIDRALTRVRELREAERKTVVPPSAMDLDTWVEYLYADKEYKKSLLALRNATPTALDLLEALLEDHLKNSQYGLCRKADDALAAFVEETDGK